MMSSWIELVGHVAGSAEFAPPAADSAIALCEQALGHPLDDHLGELLRQTNGVTDEHGTGVIWPVERIAEDNASFRADVDFADLYMPFDPLLFFADAGNGDQFAFVLRDQRTDIFVWDHETDSRTWVAADLATYLTWWFDGTLTR